MSGTSGSTEPAVDIPRMRAPKPETLARLRNGGSGDNANIKKVPFDVNAKEFVPSSSRSSLSVNAVPFIPTAQPTYAENFNETFQRVMNITQSQGTTQKVIIKKETVLKDFKNLLCNLTMNPGNIEEYCKSMVEKLQNAEEDSSLLNEIIETLFEQCVEEPNFHYTGARLCKPLFKGLKGKPVFEDLRTKFLTRCKEEYLKREDMIAHDESIPRLCGFAMFIGELFLNLEVENKGFSQRMGVLRFVIRDVLLTLLDKPTDKTIKCVTQVLKFAGSTIADTEELNKNPEERDYSKVFEKLQSCQDLPHLNQTSKLLIKSVLNLKENNWGRESSPSSVPDSSNYSNYSSAANEPVFYNQQGQPISREEAGYYDEFNDYNLEQQAAAYAYAQDSDVYNGMDPQAHYYGNMPPNYPEVNPYIPHDYQPWSPQDGQPYDDYSNYPEEYFQDFEDPLDDEIAEAFEEFLLTQQQQQQ